MKRTEPRAELETELQAGEFYGSITGSYAHDGIVLTEIVHCLERALPTHAHEMAYFGMLLDGEYREWCGRTDLEFDPGTMSFHPPGIEHRDQIGQRGGRFLSIELDLRWVDRLVERPSLSDFASFAPGSPCTLIATRLHREIHDQDSSSPLMIEGAILELLGEMGRSWRRSRDLSTPWLVRIEELLRSDLTRSHRMVDLAREAGVSPTRLTRAFRRKHACSIAAFQRRLRVLSAGSMLGDRDRSIAEVAVLCGFSDQSHLTRAFREVLGTTPGRYRSRSSGGSLD